MVSNLPKYAAELIGTFALVFFGSMSVTVLGGVDSTTTLPIALAHGLTLMVMVYAVGRISGCHINPAVTISMLSLKKIGTGVAVGYIVAQLIGAGIAGFLHMIILPQGIDTSYGLTLPSAAIGFDETTAVLVEIILTAFLVFVILNVKGENVGLPIGLTLATAWLVGGPLTGAALNPARTFGPAIVSGVFTAHWVYWVGPIVGALIAAAIYKYVLSKK